MPNYSSYRVHLSESPDYSKVTKFVSDYTYKNWFRNGHPEIGDILISTVGANIGSVSIIKENRGCITQNLVGLRTKKILCNENYLYYFLTTESIQSYLKSLNIGSAQPSLKVPHLLNISFPLPPLPEQRAIADTLSCLDDMIELNNRTNKVLEEMAQAIFKRWFIDFEFPDENGNPYKSSGGEMEESELGEIPVGWRVGKVKEVVTITRGASPRPIQDFLRDEGMPWVKISDATACESKFLLSTVQFIKEEGVSKSRLISPGTLILSNSATPGIPKIMGIESCVHDGWLIFIEYKKITKYYIYYFLLNEKEKILSLSNGSVFRNLKTDILKEYHIILPPQNLLKIIDETFISLNKTMYEIELENRNLMKIRDSLLPKLMSGEIRVPVEEG